MYKVFGESPTIMIVEWMIGNQAFDHSIAEIAKGAELSIAVAKTNFEPLKQYGVVKESRMIRKDPMYVLDTNSPCTRAIIDFDLKIAKCCKTDSQPIDDEDDEDTETGGFIEGPVEYDGPIEILPPEI